MALLVAAGAAVGYGAGGRAPTNSRNLGRYGGAAVGGVAMVFVGKKLQEERGQVSHAAPASVIEEDIAGREAMTNAEAWQKGNETYKKRFGNKGVLTSPPTKKVAVVACMDARFHVEKALALKEGDAHIIRNAGGRVSEDVIRSLAISQQLLGTEEVAVIHHTDCGMAKFEDPTLHEKIDTNLGPEAAAAAKKMKFLNFFGVDLEESVRLDLRALRNSPLLTPASKNKLTGYIYDVKSGDLNVVPA